MYCTLKQIPKALERLLGWIYIMVYLDPASNPGSKPQRLSDKSCTWKENKVFGISCKLLTKKYQENIFARKIICVLFPCATFSSKITDICVQMYCIKITACVTRSLSEDC